MLKKEYKIKNHFFRKFQRRAKNHCQRTDHKSIADKIRNIMTPITEEDLIEYKGTYFLPVKLSRNGDKPFYFLIKDDREYFALISIYTEDMFLKRYRNKIKQ